MTTYVAVAAGGQPGISSSSAAAQNAIDATSSSTGMAICAISSGGANGIYGQSSYSAKGGVVGLNNTSGGYGVNGYSTSGYGVYGQSPSSYALFGSGTYGIYTLGLNVFANNVSCLSNFTVAGTKSFIIDHPLDPENRDLLHVCVESSEMKNIYDGVGTADAAGELTVAMPDYFEALNKDLRYQLTAIGQAAPGLYIKEELTKGKFRIAGANPGQKVCWQVTGNRKDAFAEKNPFVVERDRPASERGLYRNPEAYGHPAEKRIGYVAAPPDAKL